jgi:hypothetical protein
VVSGFLGVYDVDGPMKGIEWVRPADGWQISEPVGSRVICTFFQVLGTMLIDVVQLLSKLYLLPLGGSCFWSSS